MVEKYLKKGVNEPRQIPQEVVATTIMFARGIKNIDRLTAAVNTAVELYSAHAYPYTLGVTLRWHPRI